jgi:hypothetical protein
MLAVLLAPIVTLAITAVIVRILLAPKLAARVDVAGAYLDPNAGELDPDLSQSRSGESERSDSRESKELFHIADMARARRGE